MPTTSAQNQKESHNFFRHATIIIEKNPAPISAPITLPAITCQTVCRKYHTRCHNVMSICATSSRHRHQNQTVCCVNIQFNHSSINTPSDTTICAWPDGNP